VTIKQHRPATRAPHGSPIYTARTGAWVTDKQLAWVKRNGGSAKLRELVQRAMDEEAQHKAATKRLKAAGYVSQDTPIKALQKMAALGGSSK
jgi:hypothetical protein